MNRRIDYMVKALALRMLLMIVRRLGCHQDPTDGDGLDFDKLERDVTSTVKSCHEIADGRN
jgi:hypothetical protein